MTAIAGYSKRELPGRGDSRFRLEWRGRRVKRQMSALKTKSYLQERGARGNVERALAILDKAGRGQAPPPEDQFTVGDVGPGLKMTGPGRRTRGGN
jgi:hypothetical protein